MEPQIRYAVAADGVRIALWTLGAGRPLLLLPMLPFSHIQIEWQVPERRAWYERLSQHGMLVRYDGRGTGLSEREIDDFSLESQLHDLRAVVNHLQLERFAMFAPFFAGPTAITYAAQNPERVSHLALWCTFPRTSDYLRAPQSQGIMGMIDQDWELFTETLAHSTIGWSEGEPANRFAAFMRECISQQTCKLALNGFGSHDATGMLSQVACPALVVHRRQLRGMNPNFDRDMVTNIPDCRLVLLEGESGPPFVGDLEEVHGTIFNFLAQESPFPVRTIRGPALTPVVDPLSPREIEILRLIQQGMSNRTISQELVVTQGTVKAHLNNIYRKLDVRSRTQALARSRDLGLLH